MERKYGWLITKDHVSDGDDERVFGPRNSAFNPKYIMDHPGKQAFKMYDDDGELYYEGFIVIEEDDGELDFAPLDEFGMPNAGATEIHYQNKQGEWKPL